MAIVRHGQDAVGFGGVDVGHCCRSGVVFGLWRPRPPEAAPAPETGVVSLAPVELGEGPDDWVVVHVSGRVLRPGLVRVDVSARVGDVIVAAEVTRTPDK